MRSQDFSFLGRGIHYPVAPGGALKLKEVFYNHAEGYPAGDEARANALIDENLPVRSLPLRPERSRFAGALREDALQPQRTNSLSN